MKVLVFNCGSSSLKFKLVETRGSGGPLSGNASLAQGSVDRIGGEARCKFALAGAPAYERSLTVSNHEEAVKSVLDWAESAGQNSFERFDAIGHRVVHGGERFIDPVPLDAGVIAELEALNELAPLHNPPGLAGIRATRRVFGGVPTVAVFDTAFHHTIPKVASTYALPLELSSRHGIRRYGFHGLAHRYAMLRYAEMAGKPADRVNIVTLHLGNGASACAIKNGRSVDTSMGFTPLEGLVMGTRCGDLDAAIVTYLAKKENLSISEVDSLLNQRAGLLGISGRSSDMRELIDANEDERARLAVDIFCYRARRYLGAYLVTLGGAEAVVFSGGIGERSPLVRANICADMDWCGLAVDQERNSALAGAEGEISTAASKLKAYVVETNEEILIAQDTVAAIKA